MSQEAIIENIKAELNQIDRTALLSILEIIDRSKRQSVASSDPISASADRRKRLQFVGENLTLEEFERLSLKERAMLKWQLKKQNERWLRENFSDLEAAWVLVVDGKILASGKSLRTKPKPPELLQISRRAGKFPFVFVNDKFIAIEENLSVWQETIQAGDYYPTLPIKFSSSSGHVDVVGDFDTGSSHTFVDYDILAMRNPAKFSGASRKVLPQR
jgi:hypothetical protein